jgi:glycosyltransferase involved in cell wall biosynthesis
MQREPQAHKWTAAYGIGNSVELLPFQTRHQMAELYRQAQVVVSLTTHDGTPNSLLEAMACGCFPVVGDLESLREWIRHGENGLIVDPGEPGEAAEAILSALITPSLRARAALINQELIRERAEYGEVMRKARYFYQSLIKSDETSYHPSP